MSNLRESGSSRNDKKIKVALIGVGSMGKNHLRAVSRSQDFTLAAVVDQRGTWQDPSLPELAGVETLANVEDLKEVSFDCAIIATPTPSHNELTQKMLRQRKHVLIEKPIATRAEEARSIAKLALAQERLALVGHIERCNPAIMKLIEIIKAGEIGKPIHMRTTRVGGWPRKFGKDNNVLLDLGVHDFDISTQIDPTLEVVASHGQCSKQKEVWDTVDVLLQSRAHNFQVSTHLSWLSPIPRREITIMGSLGTCTVDCIAQTCHITTTLKTKDGDDNPATRSVEIAPHDQLDYQLIEFRRALNGKSHRLSTPKEAGEAIQIAQNAMDFLSTPNKK